MAETKTSSAKQSWSSLASQLGYIGKENYKALKKDCKTIASKLEKISGKDFNNIRGLTPRIVRIIKDHLGFE